MWRRTRPISSRSSIEELPPLLAAEAEPAEFAPGRNTEVAIIRQGYGDVDAVLRSAPLVVELELAIGRHSGVPLEARGAIGRYDASRDILELHGAAKVPHRIRELLSRMLGRPPSSIHVHEWHVGGGFGIRGELYPEDVLVCVAAMRLGRPVKWIEDRREHLIAANHSRQQLHRIRAGVDREGRILAIDDLYFHDQGAYVRTHAARVVHMTAGILPGPYRVPAYRSVGHFRLTNKTPAATYRAPGRYETTFVRERLIDAIAVRLGIDPNDVRRRNAIAKDEMPYHRPLEALGEEIEHDSGDYVGLLDKLLAALDWDKLKAELARRRAAGEAVGAGFAMFVEKSGLGPADGVRIEVDTSGMVELITGGASLGQGFETVMAQVCAEMLGVDYRRVRVTHGQTDRIEFGIGAHASRATVMTASATHNAAVKLRAKAIEMAAELMQAPPDALDIVDGKVVAQGSAGGTVDEPRRDRRATSSRPRRRSATATPGLSVRRLVPDRAPGLSLRHPFRGGEGRPRDRRRCGRALRHRLRHRPRHQSGAGARADRRRLRAGPGRRAARGIHLQRARRPAGDHLRRLSAADGARDAQGRGHPARGLHEPAQSARHQGGGRERHHRRRRGDRLRHRRRHRHAGRGDAASGDAAAAEADP